MKKVILIFTTLYLLSAQAFAGGFHIPEQGAKATGMGNAFAAIADDPSAVWFNPAGIATQDGISIQVGTDIIMPKNTYEVNGASYSAKKETFIVPQAYLVYEINDDFTFGFAINAPFGLATDWTDSGSPFSAASAGGDGVTFSQIEAVHFNPNIAYQVNENVSVAAGIAYYDLRKVHLDSQFVKIGGHGDGFGANAAILYKTDDFNVGFSYRSKVKADVTGTAVGGAGLSAIDPTLVNVAGNVSTSITLPDMFSLGASFKATDSIIVSLQADRVNWSTFDQIELAFAPSKLNLLTGSTSTVPEGWKDVTTYRIGMEWAQSETSRVRAGYVIDPTPTNPQDLSPRLPGNDRTLITLGYGQDFSEAITMDLGYAYVKLKDRDLTTANKPIYNGTYTSVTHLFAASLNYHF